MHSVLSSFSLLRHCTTFFSPLPLVFALASQSKLENLSCHLSFLKAHVNVQTLLVTLLLLSGRLAEEV